MNRGSSTALLTDRYELTMLDAALASGVAPRRAVFEVFARSLPPGRRYGVFAGIGRLLEALDDFRFGGDEIAWLVGEGMVDGETGEWLRSFRFSGHLDAYAEGECYFPGSPVLTIESSFGEAVLLETLVLSILNFDSAVAAAASRIVGAAEGRPVIEMGARRVHEAAAVSSARAAYIGGCASTSSLEAGRRYGVPTAGTAAHSFVLAYRDERAAFSAQFDSMGLDTTILVDTYDTVAAIRTAVELARERGAEGPAAIRLDSGDLLEQATRARALLDDLGATATAIVLTSDLDEYSIAALARAPVDAYGVGTRMATGSGAPTAGFVYKLVAVASESGLGAVLHPVEKRSPSKHTLGARKHASRWIDEEGRARVEFVRPVADLSVGATGSTLSGIPSALPDELPEGWATRDLQHRLIAAGEVVAEIPSLADSREHHRWSVRELGAEAFDLNPGGPIIPTRYGRGTEHKPAGPDRLATVREIRPGASGPLAAGSDDGGISADPGDETVAGSGRVPLAVPDGRPPAAPAGSPALTARGAGSSGSRGRKAGGESDGRGAGVGGEMVSAPATVSSPGASTDSHRERATVSSPGASTDSYPSPEPPQARALLVVDLQRDFCEGGSLAISGGEAVAEGVAELVRGEHGYAAVVASRDWHVNPGSHFAQSGAMPDFETSWPVHCIAGSQGADMHPAAVGLAWDAVFDKGHEAAAYSAFAGRDEAGVTLATWLLDHEIDRLDVCGLATDYCVRTTVLDARQLGFQVRVLVDLTRGVAAHSTAAALAAMTEAGAELVGEDIATGSVAGSLAEQFAYDER